LMAETRARGKIVECYGATRLQGGRLANEDTFIIEREPVPFAAVFDGAGNAEQAALRAARFFKTLLTDQIAKVADPKAWENWVRLMDSRLMGGGQSTFVGMAASDIEDGQVVGASAGNSRAYLIGENGVRIISAEGSPGRLGSGRAEGKTFSLKLGHHDMLLLMSDGAWVPIGSTYLFRKTVMSALTGHFSEVPQAILDAAYPCGDPADDATVVALRIC
jgi:serine/threonine protein phosphatase PrpC